jgi:glycosyltransferase involved in cell wall biosynthesis
MLVTHVGGLPEIVPHGVAGYVVQSNVEAIAESMIDFCENNKINYFDEGIEKEKVRFQWSTMTGKFRELYDAT